MNAVTLYSEVGEGGWLCASIRREVLLNIVCLTLGDNEGKGDGIGNTHILVIRLPPGLGRR